MLVYFLPNTSMSLMVFQYLVFLPLDIKFIYNETHIHIFNYYLMNFTEGIKQCNPNHDQDKEHGHHPESSLISLPSKSLPLTIRGHSCSLFFFYCQRLVLYILESLVNGIIPYSLSCKVSVNVTFLESIYAVVLVAHSFLLFSSTPLYKLLHFVYTFTCWWLHWLFSIFLAIRNHFGLMEIHELKDLRAIGLSTHIFNFQLSRS